MPDIVTRLHLTMAYNHSSHSPINFIFTILKIDVSNKINMNI